MNKLKVFDYKCPCCKSSNLHTIKELNKMELYDPLYMKLQPKLWGARKWISVCRDCRCKFSIEKELYITEILYFPKNQTDISSFTK